MTARFQIKVRPGIVALRDRTHPAFMRAFDSLDQACQAMDNIVRRERGMPDRLPITRREIREAMVDRRSRSYHSKSGSVTEPTA